MIVAIPHNFITFLTWGKRGSDSKLYWGWGVKASVSEALGNTAKILLSWFIENHLYLFVRHSIHLELVYKISI